MTAALNFSTIPLSKVPANELIQDANKDRPVVLVVDDEAVVADSLSLILDQFGFATMTAYGSAAALEIAAVIPPELLICELALPHMNGFDLAKKITAIAPDCDVVLLSGRATSTHFAETSSNRNYEFAFLNKPFHPTVLLDAIAEPLKKRSQRFRTHLVASEDIA